MEDGDASNALQRKQGHLRSSSKREHLAPPTAGRLTSLLHSASLGGGAPRLPSQVDAGILRAVPLPEVLKGFGKHFRSSAPGTEADHSLSARVERIDYFLSHDWSTKGWQKFMSLCYVFNLRAAILGSCICAVPLACLGTSNGIYLSRVVCPFVYFFVFIFWQRSPVACRMPRSIFLDKLCINQTDDELKAAGIKGFAGFLRVSKRLVVLWSPQYFSRLWCTYELVAWCHLHGLDSGIICFLPVSWSVVHCVSVFTSSTYYLCKFLVMLKIENAMLIRAAAFALLFPLMYKMAALVRELWQAEEQIRSFAIRDSQCFCCTHNHLHPETGQRLCCDRRLVYSTLHNWHMETCKSTTRVSADQEVSNGETALCQSSVEEALNRFDATVQQDLASVVSQSLSSALLCQTYTDCVSAGIPVLWAGLDYVCSSWGAGRYVYGCRELLEFLALPLFAFPLSYAVLVMSTRLMNGASMGWCNGTLRTGLSACLSAATFFAIYVSGVVLIPDSDTVGLPDLASLLRYIVLAFLTSNVVLPPRVSCDEHGSTFGGVNETIGKTVYGQTCNGSNAGQPSRPLVKTPTDDTDRRSAPSSSWKSPLSTFFTQVPCPCENSGRDRRPLADVGSCVVTI
eukprot:TRINITY_DN25103_c0_g1_i2.p1 TRINITY_DN25103_c0_g1~~TRINITY_DN25103_c0_g1_i2.p1  ORF type:complete len:625 (-),score=42.15 TRINITY_DN25103_c0_g1_i2:347-2221(-)